MDYSLNSGVTETRANSFHFEDLWSKKHIKNMRVHGIIAPVELKDRKINLELPKIIEVFFN